MQDEERDAGQRVKGEKRMANYVIIGASSAIGKAILCSSSKSLAKAMSPRWSTGSAGSPCC